MEITQSNFNEILPKIEDAIKQCTFISLDCELTGLKTALNHVNAFDTPEQYYKKVIKDCKEFLVIQYGLTFFRYDEEANSFKHQSYNFYIFRKPLNKLVQDQRFLCQTSSIDFLINQGFDFNKLFKGGISYLNDVEENSCRKNLEEQYKKRKDFKLNPHKNEGNNDIVPIPEENQGFINDIIKQLKTFIASDETELQLPKCNAFLRRLIYQTNTEKFCDKIQLDTRVVNKDRILYASKLKSQEEIEKIEQEKYEESIKQMEDYIGFSKVVRMIVQSGKTVVGHNVFLDFVHTIDKFLTPLPDDYSEFKECASTLFKRVLDTKFIASSENFKDSINSTVLGHLLDTISEKPFGLPKYEIEEGRQSYNLKDVKEHEAGYDSFITGLCLLGLWRYLGMQRKLPVSDVFSKTGQKLLNPYLNKIFLLFLSDNQYLNLSGPDLTPSREHVFYLTFPKEWTTNNIVQLFSPFGGVYVSWLSETSAYVALFKKDQAAVALKTLCQSDTYTVMTFAKRQAQLAGLSAILPSPIKRRKSSEGSAHKKRIKTDANSSQAKRSIEPIEEQCEEDNDEIAENKSKTFAECTSWD